MAKKDINMWADEMEKKYGWYAHFVFDDKSFPYSINIHTHGLKKYGHDDLQICFPLEKQTAHYILITVADEIKSGKKYVAGMKYKNVIEKYEVEFAEAEESGRKVLRIIFPDQDGNLQSYDGKPNIQFKGCKKQFNKN